MPNLASTIEFPMPLRRPIDGHYQSNAIDFKLNGPQQKVAAYLVSGLAAAGATTGFGNLVSSPALAVRWMLDRLVPIVEEFEKTSAARMEAYGKAVFDYEIECEKILREHAEANQVPELPENGND